MTERTYTADEVDEVNAMIIRAVIAARINKHCNSIKKEAQIREQCSDEIVASNAGICANCGMNDKASKKPIAEMDIMSIMYFLREEPDIINYGIRFARSIEAFHGITDCEKGNKNQGKEKNA